jgi:hypothetical protein
LPSLLRVVARLAEPIRAYGAGMAMPRSNRDWSCIDAPRGTSSNALALEILRYAAEPLAGHLTMKGHVAGARRRGWPTRHVHRLLRKGNVGYKLRAARAKCIIARASQGTLDCSKGACGPRACGSKSGTPLLWAHRACAVDTPGQRTPSATSAGDW